ncbi:MAG TPA: ABC transporter substrate-binding protein, partial [Candidatus Paceibacterota bacterium]|nr:ABC transporter substrate-binding protein [Candidatus Paceibacterota bacterium]
MNPGWLLLTLLLAGIASGCSKGGRRADLIILNGAEPESLDPAFATGQPDLRAVGAIFEGLTRSDPRTGRAIPGLAERWDVSPDGRRYAFHLRAGARWSTGDPISADDVVYSWRRVLEPETGCDYAGQLFYVRNAEAFNRGDLKDFGAVGVRARESRLVEVELEGPTPFFLELCAIPTAAI